MGTRSFAVAALLLASCTPLPHAVTSALPNGARYVAMGSSYASGPGVTHPADARDPRCSRSNDNYAHQVARALTLDLVDVSCSGATTKQVLEGWSELPPQVDALTIDTALVTVTIGGNDLGYIGRLMGASCDAGDTELPAVKAVCAGIRARSAGGASHPVAPDQAAWAAAESGLTAIGAEVHRRSPHARLIFVEYLTVVPDGAACATVPLSSAALNIARDTSRRLARLTESIAKRSGAEFLPVAVMSRGHDACAKEPWVTSFVPVSGATNFIPYHPNLIGMTAVADALITRLR